MQESLKFDIEGHVLIKNAETGEVLVDKKNAIHFGNMTRAVANALANEADGFIHFMKFGNNGTAIDPTGQIIYKSPNTSSIPDTSSSLYNVTYEKVVEELVTPGNLDPDRNFTEVIFGSTNFADIKVHALLDFGEPSDQENFDTATSNAGSFVFDELGLFTTDSLMLTHVIFHPVQKSLNRVIEIVYTVRIQMNSC